MMDNFTLIFIVVAVLGLYAFWKIARFIFKLVKNAQPNEDSSVKFFGDSSRLPEQFNEIVKKLEKERVALYNKTKGLFKRAFFRTWLFSGSIFLLLTAALSTTPTIDAAMIIGPLAASMLLSLVGAGIFTVIKKGTIGYKFSRQLKKQLVSEIVTHINPNLSFSGEAIEEDEFNGAELFYGSVFTSEDTIEGTVEDEYVSISECEQRNSSNYNRNEATITYFNGLFVQLHLKKINLSVPLKLIPTYNLEKNTLTIDLLEENLPIGSPNILRIQEENEIKLNVNSPFKAYCENEAEALALMDKKFLKVVDFIFGKYEYRDVFISINNDKLFLAISWNQDMFETNAFLKKSLIESKIAEKIYQDILFINQVIKEVGLINKLG